MKFWIKLFFKTLAGGLGAFLLFSMISGLADALSHLIQSGHCAFLFSAPILFLLGLLGLELDDWRILFFLLGAVFAFILQIRPVLTVYFPDSAKQIFRISMAFSLAFASMSIGIDWRKDYEIEKMYSEFCQAYNEQEYELAYSYFSPEYRSEVGLGSFIKMLRRYSYVDTCDSAFRGTIFHRLNGASIYPYHYTVTVCDFVAGPELILIRIDGKWYFTGEHHWYSG
jgi:hypothetical protein